MRTHAGLALAALLLAACSSIKVTAPKNPIRLTLTNKTEKVVDGAVLRFNRDLLRADLLTLGGFQTLEVRIAPANVVVAKGGQLGPGDSVTMELAGLGGPPEPEGGRWFIGGMMGPNIRKSEMKVE